MQATEPGCITDRDGVGSSPNPERLSRNGVSITTDRDRSTVASTVGVVRFRLTKPALPGPSSGLPSRVSSARGGRPDSITRSSFVGCLLEGCPGTPRGARTDSLSYPGMDSVSSPVWLPARSGRLPSVTLVTDFDRRSVVGLRRTIPADQMPTFITSVVLGKLIGLSSTVG